MVRLVIIVEEQSKRVFLEHALRRVEELADVQIIFHVADGYPDILRLVGAVTRAMRDPNMRFLILCDQDSLVDDG